MKAIGLDGVEFTPVSPRYIPLKLVTTALTGLFWLALTAVPLILKLTGVWPELWDWVAWGLPALTLIELVVDLVLVPRRVRAMGWAEQEDELLWRTGLFFRSVISVPYGRLQYLDLKDDPLQRHFGVRSLELKTASSGMDTTMKGIPETEAERLREVLMARGQAKLAGL